ncbi:hypothetical protein ARMSODRAFT_712291 [Armillaria solidipes]|uniref:Uncharacterized protein n=1 Tax=Armillaria solidipes TaxID=1076256 RepID=A0A2H3C3W9_9AGAR|nr:hypothetical protein ARMSODRAFT_712291 [Armillaria solidipes]
MLVPVKCPYSLRCASILEPASSDHVDQSPVQLPQLHQRHTLHAPFVDYYQMVLNRPSEGLDINVPSSVPWPAATVIVRVECVEVSFVRSQSSGRAEKIRELSGDIREKMGYYDIRVCMTPAKNAASAKCRFNSINPPRGAKYRQSSLLYSTSHVETPGETRHMRGGTGTRGRESA